MNIPFFNYPRLYTDQKTDMLRIFEDVASRGAFIMQSDLLEFEDSFAKFTKSNYALGVANGTDAMELALMAIGLNPGDEIIICSHTMVATASAIVTAGGMPVPVELGYDNLIDPQAIEDAITANTVGIMPTQLNGRTCNMDAIKLIAKKHSLFIVEDSAQALGSTFKGQHAGTFGLAGGISFFPAKVLGCFGDGGGVLIQDKELYHKIYQLHDHGRDTDGEIKSWGRNSRLDNLQAAFLNHGLASYQNIIDKRRSIATLYQEQLGDLEELMLPIAPNMEPDHYDVFQNYELEADDRDQLQAHLKANGIGTLIQWSGKAVHQFPELGFNIKLPKVEKFFERCLMLPMNIFLSEDEVTYISNAVRGFYRS
ncbi:DegT/DnrJ/EryC1/StrS family aminotransferase [Pseudomonadota bacterium]|nr:DegT/DnrJ/EryC1/StrS family aminotransferase [Pseudomonadota bacterium]